jgi:hypothetical protein
MKKVSEAIIFFFGPSFYWYFKKNENSIFLKKNGHFSLKKMIIFMQKNAIFIFKKIPIKRRTKNIYYYFIHFFHFLLCYFFKK